ncbi:putative [histone H3]-lysine(4) N-trimethyltransferase chromatin remodeling SET family [Dioscorea sansibarensis]
MKKKIGGGLCSVGQVFEQMLKQLDDHHPVEFQLPDWLKKRKSTPYTFIKRNLYLTKKMKRRAEDDGIFCSCSPSSAQSAVCDKDCLCGMLLSSCSQSCNCGNLCANKPFQSRPVKKMKLVETEKCGSGLVADEEIKQGDFVIEYVGEVIDDKTCEERLWKMKHRGETNFYLCEINRDMVIDATYKGNKSRYINHSCQPNTEMQKWTIDGETRIGIFATRDIKKGEELTYDYQFVQFGADQDCFCGSAACRQKLGNKPSKSDAALQLVLCEMAASSPTVQALLYGKDDFPGGRSEMGSLYLSLPYKKKTSFQNCIGEVIRIWCRCAKRYYGGVILEFNGYSRKHTIINEEGLITTLDLSKEDWDLL